MKHKTNGAIIAIAIGMLVVLSSCKLLGPNESLPLKNAFNVKITKGRLAFATIEDYERIVNQPDSSTIATFANVVKSFADFAPLKFDGAPDSTDTLQLGLINDDYFASMLNKDGIIQIGNYIFKIDAKEEMVYVLPLTLENENQDFMEAIRTGKNIMRFSTDDDVLDSLKDGTVNISHRNASAKSNLFGCRDRSIGSKYMAQFFPGNMAYATYNKYGIFFSLHAFIPTGSWPTHYLFDFYCPGCIHYHVRCGGTVDYAITTSGTWTGTNQKYQSYQGSTNLDNMFFAFRVLDKNTGQPLSAPVVIRENW